MKYKYCKKCEKCKDKGLELCEKYKDYKKLSYMKTVNVILNL